MSKNQNKPAAKEPKKPAAAPAPKKEKENNSPAPKTEKKEEAAEVVNVSVAADPKKLTDRRYSGLSADGQVRLLDLARRTFVEEQDPDLQFPKEVRKSVNQLVSIGIMCQFADEAANGNTTFALVLQSQAYPALTSAAESIGLKLPDIKTLQAGTREGTLMLPASSVVISKETKEKLQKEKEIRESEKPELDPTKIDSEEGVKKALEYIFVTSGGKRLPKLLLEAVDFMKKFREHEAELAENTDEAKAKFANYNTGDWLDDVFSYFRPPIFFSGIGRGMAGVAAVENSPIHAFIILREAIKDSETKQPVLSDSDTAFAMRSILKWVCNTNIASNTKAIENLDAKKNAKEISLCEAQIAKYNNVLKCITSPDFKEIDELLDNIGSHFDEKTGQLTDECQHANMIFNNIVKSYYPEGTSTTKYKNLEANVQQYGYHIINLFRDPGEKIVDCGLAYVGELEERTAEEQEAIAKEAKKAWAERKAKQKEESSKNE